MADGTEQALRELLADGREWVTTGQVTGFEVHASLGYLVNFSYVEDGRAGQGRLAVQAFGDTVTDSPYLLGAKVEARVKYMVP